MSKFTTTNTALLPASSVDWTPRGYQKTGVRFFLQNAVGAAFLDCGLGKTAMALAAIKILIEKGIVRRVLIIAPIRVCYTVWPEEVKKWTEFNGLRVEVLHGTKKDEALRRDADIYVINPDGLAWLSLEKRYDLLDADTLIVDESTAFKSSNTQRFKLLKYLLSSFRRRYIMTGTPTPNGMMDLFGQIYILDQGAALGRYITQYRSTFFDPVGYMGYDYRLKPGAAEAINDRIKLLALRMAAKDYLDLPERVDNRVVVELPAKARKLYQDLERQFLGLLESGEVLTAPSAAAVGIKLRQIANGGVYRNAEHRVDAKVHTEEWSALHDAKLDALEEIIESQQGKPTLVAYEFQHDATRIKKRFPQAVFVSDYPGAKLNAIFDAWNAGEIAMLCAHPASAGHGLNLQKDKDTIVWFGLTWNLEYYDQLNARILRQGNDNSHVFIHHIIAKDTIDEVIMKVIKDKGNVQTTFLAALKEMRS